MTAGNPELDPSGSERFAIGGEARKGPYFLGVEWYRLSRSGLPGAEQRQLGHAKPG